MVAEPIRAATGNGWDYDPVRNRIVFYGTALPMNGKDDRRRVLALGLEGQSEPFARQL